MFAMGQAVVLKGLVARVDLEGKRGIVKSFDSTSLRYAVCINDSGDMVEVLGDNLQPSIFAA